MKKSNNVVVTGMGVVTPIGVGLQDFYDAMLQGRSGVKIRPELAEIDGPLKLYSPIEDFDGKKWVRPRKAMKVMCRPIQFGFAAATMALEHAGIDENSVNPDRKGTVFGSETFFADPQEVASVFRKCVTEKNYLHDRWGEFAMREIQPLWMLKYLPNMVASHISIVADARGPSNSICQGEASSLLATIEGADLILRGVCDVVIVGGTGSQTSLSGMLYRGQHLMSHRVDEPARACRPFDAQRDGTVYGEGAGALILESESHALARGAKPIVQIQDWSRNFHAPKSNSLADSISMGLNSMKDSGKLELQRLSHVNAHGLASPNSDRQEANAIQTVLGDVPVTAIKSYFGHLGPGSPTIELIASLIGMQSDQLPATMNYENPDDECPINVITEFTPTDRSDALKISLSETGQIAALLVRKY